MTDSKICLDEEIARTMLGLLIDGQFDIIRCNDDERGENCRVCITLEALRDAIAEAS